MNSFSLVIVGIIIGAMAFISGLSWIIYGVSIIVKMYHRVIWGIKTIKKSLQATF
jgi:hypothetical protein